MSRPWGEGPVLFQGVGLEATSLRMWLTGAARSSAVSTRVPSKSKKTAAGRVLSWGRRTSTGFPERCHVVDADIVRVEAVLLDDRVVGEPHEAPLQIQARLTGHAGSSAGRMNLSKLWARRS